jgi:hypothetical protein
MDRQVILVDDDLIGLLRFGLAKLGLNGSTSQIPEAMMMHLPSQFDQDTILRQSKFLRCNISCVTGV